MSTPVSRTTARTDDVTTAAEEVAEIARPLSDRALDALVERVGDDRYVLLGEASHGTAEFYRLRARLTARLLREEEFSFVAVEGDWTDCYELNRYVTGDRDDPEAVFGEFDRWPTWMWANWEVREFADWLREFNAARAGREDPVGFYGMDVYSLFESMAAVVDYLEDVDPAAAERARDAYHCFSPYGEDARDYARSTRLAPKSCKQEVLDVLTDLRERALEYRDRTRDGETYFDAEQNALVASNAEAYYRAMVDADTESWNVRDEHMAETLERLVDHHDGKAIVWAHNTHVGDARATDMADRGRVNIGQLLRERNDDEVALVGFGTHRGEVVAGEEWDAPRETMRVPPAREGSYGDAFDRAGVGDALVFADDVSPDGALAGPRGHRAIGVVYHPDREWGNYVPTVLPERYDALLHIEETGPLHPIDATADERGPPEAYPWGL